MKKKLHDIAKEYGKVRKMKMKTDRYGLEEKYAMYATQQRMKHKNQLRS